MKPQNVLVADDGDAFLTDFGLSRAATDTATASRPTLGTVAYIAPEVIRGEPPTPASDRYSFAATLFHCLTGDVVFPRGSDIAVIYAHTSEAPPRISERRPGLPESLDGHFEAALAKDPAERPASATALVGAVREALGETAGADLGAPAPPVTAPPPAAGAPAGAGKPSRRRWIAAVVATGDRGRRARCRRGRAVGRRRPAVRGPGAGGREGRDGDRERSRLSGPLARLPWRQAPRAPGRLLDPSGQERGRPADRSRRRHDRRLVGPRRPGRAGARRDPSRWRRHDPREQVPVRDGGQRRAAPFPDGPGGGARRPDRSPDGARRPDRRAGRRRRHHAALAAPRRRLLRSPRPRPGNRLRPRGARASGVRGRPQARPAGRADGRGRRARAGRQAAPPRAAPDLETAFQRDRGAAGGRAAGGARPGARRTARGAPVPSRPAAGRRPDQPRRPHRRRGAVRRRRRAVGEPEQRAHDLPRPDRVPERYPVHPRLHPPLGGRSRRDRDRRFPDRAPSGRGPDGACLRGDPAVAPPAGGAEAAGRERAGQRLRRPPEHRPHLRGGRVGGRAVRRRPAGARAVPGRAAGRGLPLAAALRRADGRGDRRRRGSPSGRRDPRAPDGPQRDRGSSRNPVRRGLRPPAAGRHGTRPRGAGGAALAPPEAGAPSGQADRSPPPSVGLLAVAASYSWSVATARERMPASRSPAWAAHPIPIPTRRHAR